MASFLALAFASCEPMEDVYDELDGLKKPYTQEIEVTLADDDYVTIGTLALEVAKSEQETKDANSIKKYKNFSKYIAAADYIPMFLSDQYPTLETGSVADVTYKFYQGSLSYLRDLVSYKEELAAMESYELTNEDYDSMGTDSGQPGKYNNFDSNMDIASYLNPFFSSKYPDAVADFEVFVTYRFYAGGGVTNTVNEFWAYNGSTWAMIEKELPQVPEVPEDVEVYELVADDYDSMGTPGKYDNFGSSDPASKYLPIFLAEKYKITAPEAGDKVAVLYKEYNGSETVVKAVEYSFDGLVWAEYASTIMMSGQYILTVNGWVFDPTIIFTMVSSDYQMIVDYSIAAHGKTSDYPDSEYYYGSSGKYSNFDLRLKNRNTEDYPMPEFAGLSTEDAVALTMERMKEGVAALLTVKYPDAVAQVSGIDVFYMVDVKAYLENLTDGFYTLKFQCTKSGPNPEFTYIEGLPE